MQRAHESLRQGLVGAWCPSLGATGYTLIDRCGRNMHGTLTNMDGQRQWEASGGKLSVLLDGANDYVNIMPSGRMYPNLSAVCVSCWVNFVSFSKASGYSTILETVETSGPTGGTSSYQFSPLVNSSGKLAFYVYNSSSSQSGYDGTGVFTLAPNTWYALAFVFVGGVSQQGFVNGVLDGQAASPVASISASTATQAVRIGFSQYADRYPAMRFDDFRVYNRRLTVQEIKLLATQRGIGLVPQRQRRTSASSKRLYLKVGGAWKETVPFVNVGGTWKEAAVYRRDGTSFRN